MAITVRAARPDDRAAVGAMLGEFIEYLNAIEIQEMPADAPADLIGSLLDLSFGPDPVCSTLIAEQDGRAVGYVSHHPGVWEIYRTVYVISLFVRGAARGTGAGKALMQAVNDLAARDGAQRIVWEVWSKNPLAIDFYQGIGSVVHDDNLRMSLVVRAR